MDLNTSDKPRQLKTIVFDVEMDKIQNYADICDDYNPIHVDPEFAASSPMGGVIAHGTMSLALIWQSLNSTFGAEAVATVDVDIRFVKPVRPGDRLNAGGDLAADGGYAVWVRNQNGEDVIKGNVSFDKSTS